VNHRIGHGYDIHRLQIGGKLMLAGVQVAADLSPIAHSDGDVVLHALVDALLGAAGLGDIGMHFPDTDPQWRGADSGRFVRHACTLLARQGYRVVNADLIRSSVAQLLQVEVGCVNIKATTPEHLGFLGRKEGLAAMASALIERVPPAPV
jgi:2-C-methyl-D-erythritol 2,4-cyclodiphosphate synthase